MANKAAGAQGSRIKGEGSMPKKFSKDATTVKITE